MENRANQLNPNNRQYHTSRGLDSRPDNWQDQILKNRAAGYLEYRANTSASKINHAAIGRDVVRIERVVKTVLGQNVFVYKGGSVKKHTNIEGSDLDLKIDVVEPVTDTQRNSLFEALKKEYGANAVEMKQKVHVIQGESGPIDLFPQKADYFSTGTKVDKLGKEPFKTNPMARNAVRILKLDYLPNTPGIKIERSVLEALNMNTFGREWDLESLILESYNLAIG